jgi:hypothetical protein
MTVGRVRECVLADVPDPQLRERESQYLCESLVCDNGT